ncbi:hypothetical protein BDZ89DRAFT_1062648 [Hymenopellis radicata]|nr:hypothetical protein BDZ89DRAFT_1062648 [Hymenopellis radicata]
MASTSFSSSDYTIFSPSSRLNPSPLITMPVADLFLGNPIRNRCLVPIPDMLEADDGASTRLTSRKRTTGAKRNTSLAVSMLQGSYTSKDVLMDASVGDDMTSADSEEDCGSEEETNEEMEVSGWMVLRHLKRPVTPISTGCRPFLTTERLKPRLDEEESAEEQLAEEDEILERITRSRVDKGKGRAMEKGPAMSNHDDAESKVRPLGSSIIPNRNGAGEISDGLNPPSAQHMSEQLGLMIAEPTASLDNSNVRATIIST